jgi:hypothetical protein
MTTRSKTVRTIGFTLALITSVISMSTASHAYTQEQAQMCTGDAFKFCSSEIPNIEKITACMQKNKALLSAGCKSVMAKSS